MIEAMRVTFYNVAQCGYYAHANPAPQFGSMGGLLSELRGWSQGKQLAQTRIGSPAGDGDQLPIYLSAIDELQGTYLVTAWNEVPADKDGNVASVPAAAPVGRVKQVNNAVQPGTIPGYPTFFWLLPSEQVVATLRFNQAVTGQKAFQEYLEQFLAVQSSHAVMLPPNEKSEDEPLTVWAYRANPKATPTTKVAPRFRTKLVTKPGQIDMITRRVADIRRVHRKAELELKDTTERAMWQKALSFIGVEPAHTQPKKAKVQASMSATVTSAELKTIIKEWQGKNGSSEWDDCGFQFTGETEVHWLSGVRASGDFNIDVTRSTDNAQIEARKLLAGLLAMKAELLGLLK